MTRFLSPASRLVKSLSSVRTLKTPEWLGNNFFSTYEESLLKIPPTRLSVLDNGLRVASEDTGSQVATVGLWIDTGSRFEAENNNGAGYFLEHLAFKGTKKRSQTDLELEVENLGANLNAYTSREQTAFYAKCLSQDVPKVIELLSDIIQNSKLGETDIERERSVILQELQELEKNNLKQVVFDHLHSVAFQGTDLGKSVFGPTKNIESLSRQDLVNYINQNYKAPRIVLAGAGGIEHDALVNLAKEHFKGLESSVVPELDYCRFTGSEVRDRDDSIPLAHVAIAFQGVGWSHQDKIPLLLANTLLGSYDRTNGGGDHNACHLVQAASTGNLCHSFQGFNINYKDTGLWGIYFVCDRLTIDDFIWNILNEFMRLCTGVTDFELERAKNILRTNLLLQQDGTTSICADIGSQVINNGRRIPFHELDAQIEAVNADIIRDVCYRQLYDRCPAVAGVGPIEQLTDYNNIRAGMYWLRV